MMYSIPSFVPVKLDKTAGNPNATNYPFKHGSKIKLVKLITMGIDQSAFCTRSNLGMITSRYFLALIWTSATIAAGLTLGTLTREPPSYDI
ncbi:hypothetical protein L1987_39429 [Smallanthus sonchifolius]|uniref:Uncharacterized protein n=1 Tax=Smallanthus sonchifolius TaxID=185202 RepID=A0ACB9HMP0_9ASTR|nr:hypothetical protein L1987_39429 [Smallanthus sonchifolius]